MLCITGVYVAEVVRDVTWLGLSYIQNPSGDDGWLCQLRIIQLTLKSDTQSAGLNNACFDYLSREETLDRLIRERWCSVYKLLLHPVALTSF